MLPVDVSAPEDPWAGAVLLHPHPDYGGNRLNVVVEALFRGLPRAGVSAARFDFSSSDERSSVLEATEAVERMATRPLVIVGYSFGAGVAARLTGDELAGWFLVTWPHPGAVRPPVADDPRPKAIVVPELDQFASPADVRERTREWANTTVRVIPGTDHFLAGGTTEVVSGVLAWLGSIAAGPAPGGDRSLSTPP